MHKPDSFPLRQFFQLLLPVLLLILGGAWYVGQARIDAEFSLIRAHERLIAGLSAGQMNSQLQVPVRHLRAIAGEQPVRRAIDSRDPAAVAPMAAAFMTLLSRNTTYDAVRWLDEGGMEKVRVNNVNGHPVPAPASSLQNKQDRYYFKDSMRLGPDEIYVSPLDLNVEDGRVEIPYKPTLRVAMPAHDQQGQPRGILIINVAMRNYLDAFTAGLEGSNDHLMLLNRDGYWLKSPDPADEWGFMFQRKETLASRSPAAWKLISSAASGQAEMADGLWTWSTVYPLGVRGVTGVSQPQHYLVVTHLSAARLAPVRAGSWRVVGGFAALLLLLSGALIGRLMLVQGRHQRADMASTDMLAKSEVLLRQVEAQQRFRHVVEASINGILVADGTGRIVLVNPALLVMFGYESSELVGQPVEMLLPEAVRHQHVQQRSAYTRQPRSRAMGAGRELLGRRRDGTQFPVEVGLSSYSSEGATYVLATVVDISERNQLLEASMRLASIVHSTEDAIISKTLDGIITSWNPGAEKLFGYRAAEAIGQSIELLLPPGHEYEERELLARIGRGEIIDHYDTVRRHKDGHLVDISTTICPLRDAQGRVIGGAKIARDITQLRQAQARIQNLNASLEQRVKDLATANHELDSFAYAVSHDLRAPLRAMSGFSHALLEDYGARLDDTARGYLAEIGNASRRMGELIDGILALSRSTRGQLRYEAIDLSAMAGRIRDELAGPEPGRAVQWQIAAGLEAWGDPRLIENVLRNLIGNAWKYSAGVASAVIRVYAEESDGARWYCVADNGAGFDMQHAAKLYQPFQRLHRQDEFPGLGIGLATVQRIINRHHGTLRACAEPGKGATFAFTLPQREQVQKEAA